MPAAVGNGKAGSGADDGHCTYHRNTKWRAKLIEQYGITEKERRPKACKIEGICIGWREKPKAP